MADVELSSLGSVLKAAYEGETNTNAFTDAEQTKLAGIETSATADQTNAEIETAYNAQVAAASQVEAEAGTEAAIRRFSPLRIGQAIAALAGGGTDDQTAAEVPFTPAGDVAATDVQAAIEELDTEKANVADLATVATSGSYDDLSGKPTTEPQAPISITTTPRLLTIDERGEDLVWLRADTGASVVRVSETAPAGSTWLLVNGITSTVEIEVENDSGEVNGSAGGSVFLAGVIGKSVVIRVESNAGSAPVVKVQGDTTETRLLDGDLDAAGKKIFANAADIQTVSGALTMAGHSGKGLKTSGSVTIPTTAGFHCELIAGGAHTVTFNSLVSAAMAAGDIMTILVESATIIHARLSPAAEQVAFS